MAKKRGKALDTPIKDQATLEKVLEGKSKQKIADEMGIDRNTVTKRIQRALSNEQIQAMIQRSIDRNAMMLSKCDHVVNRILDTTDPMAAGVQLRATEGIYKSFGVWKNEPPVVVQNIIPIQVKVDGKTYEFSPNLTEEKNEV